MSSLPDRRDHFFPFLGRVHTASRCLAADASQDGCCDSEKTPGMIPSSGMNHHSVNSSSKRRGLLLLASACSLFAVGAIVCGLFPAGGPRHSSASSADKATGLRSAKDHAADLNAATAALPEEGRGDAQDDRAFPIGHGSLADHQASLSLAKAAAATATASTTAASWNRKRSGRRRLLGENVAGGEEPAGNGGAEEMDADSVDNVGIGTLDLNGPPLASFRIADDNSSYETVGKPMTLTRRSTLEDVESPSGDGVPSVDEGSDEGICSPLTVEGLEHCPEMMQDGDLGSNTIVQKLLETKAEILRQVIEVLEDPASSGRGGKPDEPLLLIQKLAVDETDAIFGAFEKRFLRHAVDSTAWSPLPGGFNRWVELYHRKVLRQSRPVVITVHGDDVCALEKEISLEARMKDAGVAESQIESVLRGGVSPASALAQARRQTENNDHRRRADEIGTDKLGPTQHIGEGREDFDVPVVLMTLGWDPAGDPTHHEKAQGRDRTCTYRMLENSRVVRWFTSHTRYDSHTDAKFFYLPIGFGGYETRNGLPHTAYIDAAKRQLSVLETCPVGESGSYDLLFQCNTLDRDPRTAIWKEMTEGKGPGVPIPINRAPLQAADMVTATAKGIFAVSPPGTGADCFRHYEMMLEGNIALVPDIYSMRQFVKGLPAFHYGGKEAPWRALTCGQLMSMAESVQATIKEGKEGTGRGLQFEKLTHGYWRDTVRREVLRAVGITDERALANYVERSAIPLNPHGWHSFRRVGCFYRDENAHHHHQNPRKDVELEQQRQHRHHHHFNHKSRHPHYNRELSVAGSEPSLLIGIDRTPEECAAHCSIKSGGGIGFFGIDSGDECWCDKVPGNFLPMKHCDIDCYGERGRGRCGGDHSSSVYVFGPHEKGMPFEYMGCFPTTEHVMYHATVRLGKATTPFMCEAFCTSLRFPFFALDRHEWCRCGVMPANTPRSDKTPAFIEGAGFVPVPGPPNATRAAKPNPEGVRVGDPRFQCHKGRCAANPKMWGCGADRAYDLYRSTDPCVLYRDCGQP